MNHKSNYLRISLRRIYERSKQKSKQMHNPLFTNQLRTKRRKSSITHLHILSRSHPQSLRINHMAQNTNLSKGPMESTKTESYLRNYGFYEITHQIIYQNSKACIRTRIHKKQLQRRYSIQQYLVSGLSDVPTDLPTNPMSKKVPR